ncbi:MAG: T9SS type A sorting domain-containing protein [Paludibacter sp.]|jgi:hypothetical protein|nr:T9SS type A sorting domain-containing protein [Paludibacter sp.]
MKKTITYFFIIACAAIASAQTPQWQWAKSGGDWRHSTDNYANFSKDMEQIKGMAVDKDKDNNIYFAALIGGNVEQYPVFCGIEIPVYNVRLQALGSALTDVLVGKMDCNGNLLWHYVIGSDNSDNISGFGIDTLGGVYVSIRKPAVATLLNCGNSNNQDTAIVTNAINYLVKLDTAGNYQWIHHSTFEERLYKAVGLAVEKDGTLHWLISANANGLGNYYTTTIENGQIVMDSAFLSMQDMIVARYDKDGNYLNYVSLPILNAARNNDQPDNNVYFRYDPVNQHYYLGGYLLYVSKPNGEQAGRTGKYHVVIAGDTVWQTSVYNGVRDYETGESYIATFDYNGNHLWHKKGKSGIYREYISNPNITPRIHTSNQISQVFSFEIDNTGSVYIAAKTDDIGQLVSDSLYLRVIKISPNGDMLWNDINHNEIRAYYGGKVGVNNKNDAVALFSNNQYSYVNGMWQGSNFSGVSELVFKEFDKTTLQQTAQYEWTSDLRYNILKAENNVPTTIVADSYGNYIIGGAVGTRFYLNNNDSSVMILNYGMKDTDFWLGKFGNKDCVGNAIDNPADTALSVSAVSISEIKIYPNPAKNELFINFPAAENVDNSPVVEIFNITGQRMLSTKYTNHQSINISTLQSGIYILKLGKYYGRFVKN